MSGTKAKYQEPMVSEVEESTGVADGIVLALSEEKKLVRKIDLHLLPLMLVLYILQYLDKTSLGYAAIMGIREDTKLVGQDYSWVSSLFYFGYLFASPFASIVFVKWPIGKTITISTILWSIVLGYHAAANSFASLGALRFLLGVFEATISPGFSLITAMWYKPSEHASRHSFWVVGNAIAGIFGGALSYAIGHIKSTIAGWKWLFIIFAFATFAWSLVLFFFLPNSPAEARFLTKEQRIAATIRVQCIQHSNKTNKWKWDQFFEALMDPKTWLFFAYAFASSVPNGGLTNFGSIIAIGFGYSTFQTLLLGIPQAVFQMFYVLVGGLLASKIPNSRCIVILSLCSISATGIIMVKKLPTSMKRARLGGMWLSAGFSGAFPICLSLIASNTAGYTKKATVSAIFFVGYCLGNITGPLTFYSTQAPTYSSAFTAMVVCFCITGITALVLRQTMVYMNKKRDRAHDNNAQDTGTATNRFEEDLLLDETDWKNQDMRYQL